MQTSYQWTQDLQGLIRIENKRLALGRETEKEPGF